MLPADAIAGRGLVVLEPDIEGHPREWLEHLIQYAAGQRLPYLVWFVVAAELYGDLATRLLPETSGNIRIAALRPREQAWCTHRILALSGFARWWVMRRYLRMTGAQFGHFLAIDHLSLPLALGLGCGEARLSGILFRPSVHYRALGTYRPRLRERLRDLRKAILYRLALSNHAIGVVLTLDPYYAVYAAARRTDGGKVRPLVDPAHPCVDATSAEGRLARTVPAERICFVLFGYLSRRKGVLVLLEALRLLPPEISRRAAFLLAGKVEGEIRAAVVRSCRLLWSERDELWLRLENRRLAAGELAAVVGRADVVLAPYQRFVGSSGVLIWAARAGKPVLTQDYGLLGRLVRDHALGLAADVGEPGALAASIARMVVQGPARFIDAQSACRFVAERTPQRFAATVFSSAQTR
jgi:glycosyltransferase involved in cell wall biosynthesis